MSNVNCPLTTLVGSANTAASAGDAFADLATGEVAFFDASTNLAVVSVASVKEFYIVKKNADGTVMKSPVFQTAGIESATKLDPVTGVNKVVEVIADDVIADTEYTIKLDFSNNEIFTVNGYNQYLKAVTTVTPDATVVSQAEMLEALAARINADSNIPATATFAAHGALDDSDLTAEGCDISGDLADGAAVSAANLALLIAHQKAYPTSTVNDKVSLIITTEASPLGTSFQIQPKYAKPRQTDVIVSLIAGFTDDDSATVITNLVYAQGSGYDVNQLEFESYGFRKGGNTSRVSAVTGLPWGDFYPEAVATSTYCLYAIRGENKVKSGYQSDIAPIECVIAILSSASTAIAGIKTVVNTIPSTPDVV